ncbi:MAG: dTDP-4-dehydrorhamnose reductase [Planctomycetota bacterium]
MSDPADFIPAYVIVGANGMLGRAWRELLEQEQLNYLAYDRHQLDITDADAVAAKIAQGVRFVINGAAYTDVDGCEEHEAEAMRINAEGVARLAERCAAIGATLVHFSTDYVFAGDAETPYPVDAPIAPISAYGRTKAAAEQAILDAGCSHRIIRTSWLYAPWGNNFVRTMMRLTEEKDTLSVVDDQRGRPTSARHLVAVTKQLLLHAPDGVYHVTDGGECTWFEFTREIARQAGHECDVRPCTTDQFPRPAKRPAYSVLDLSRTEAAVGPMPHWKDNLAAVLDEMMHPTPAP